MRVYVYIYMCVYLYIYIYIYIPLPHYTHLSCISVNALSYTGPSTEKFDHFSPFFFHTYRNAGRILSYISLVTFLRLPRSHTRITMLDSLRNYRYTYIWIISHCVPNTRYNFKQIFHEPLNYDRNLSEINK